MFRSINSKFYAIAVLLIISFSTGYIILAYFLHQQTRSTVLARDALSFQKDFSKLNRLFNETRFWDRELLTRNNPDAEMHYGALIEQIRALLHVLNRKEFDPTLQLTFTKIAESFNQYEKKINQLIQLKTKQSLVHTQMETNYRSMVSIILSSNNPSLLKPLFNLTHFLTSYRSARDPAKFQALKLVIDSIDQKVHALSISDSRMVDYLYRFRELLEEDYRMEGDIISLNEGVENINNQLRSNFSHIISSFEVFLSKRLHETNKISHELRIIFLISAIFGISFLLFILHLISKNIITPIRAMATVMQDVKGGNIDARFNCRPAKNDELMQLGLSLNDMLSTLSANNQKLVAYQKELEEKIYELSEREKERQLLTTQLHRAQKMEAIGTLAAGVAHDLNNVLSGIVSYPEMLLLDLADDSPLKKPIATIQESGQKAAAIVQDLLTLARRGVAVTDITNLNDLVLDYLSSPEYDKLKSFFPKVNVEVKLEKDLLNIKGSPVHLMKTIMNLAANAAESIPDAGEICIRTKNQYIDKPIRGYDNVEEGDYSVLTIKDTGTGILAEDLERIFEPFFTKKIMGRSGSGLGMAVVWGTVKDHHGYIDVHSVEGQGTRFNLYFPVTRQIKLETNTSCSLEDLMGDGESILVIDDIRRQRQISADILRKLGYHVATAASGEEAIEHLKTNSADLLVLDMIMYPGIDGLDTYKRILEISPNQKAIIASGYSEDNHVKAAQRLGAGDYLKKPFSLAKLGETVKRELAKSHN